tara:strand:- start:490 stop:669 length:180 start_codon:yes stop_codon:yes gene_type:complete
MEGLNMGSLTILSCCNLYLTNMRYAYTIVSSSAAEDNMISAAPIEKKYWKYCPFCGVGL